jgi:hypothetical protein
VRCAPGEEVRALAGLDVDVDRVHVLVVAGRATIVENHVGRS